MTPRADKLELLRSPQPDWRSAPEPLPPFPSFEDDDDDNELRAPPPEAAAVPALPTTPPPAAAVEETTEIRLPEALATKAASDAISTGSDVVEVRTAEVSSQTEPALEGVLRQLEACTISQPGASYPSTVDVDVFTAHPLVRVRCIVSSPAVNLSGGGTFGCQRW